MKHPFLKVAKKRNREEYMVTKDGDRIFTVYRGKEGEFRVKEHLFNADGEEESLLLFPERFSSVEQGLEFIGWYVSWRESNQQFSPA